MNIQKCYRQAIIFDNKSCLLSKMQAFICENFEKKSHLVIGSMTILLLSVCNTKLLGTLVVNFI